MHIVHQISMHIVHQILIHKQLVLMYIQGKYHAHNFFFVALDVHSFLPLDVHRFMHKCAQVCTEMYTKAKSYEYKKNLKVYLIYSHN